MNRYWKSLHMNVHHFPCTVLQTNLLKERFRDIWRAVKSCDQNQWALGQVKESNASVQMHYLGKNGTLQSYAVGLCARNNNHHHAWPALTLCREHVFTQATGVGTCLPHLIVPRPLPITLNLYIRQQSQPKRVQLGGQLGNGLLYSSYKLTS